MKKHTGQEDMQRWRDSAPGDATVEGRAAALITGALSPREPDARKLARVEQELFAPEQKRGPSRLVFRAAIVVVVMIAGAATVKAYEMARRSAWFGLRAPTTSTPPTKAPSRRPGNARRMPSSEGRPAAVLPTDDGRTESSLPEPLWKEPHAAAESPSGVRPSSNEPGQPATPSPRISAPTATEAPSRQGTTADRPSRKEVQLAYAPPRLDRAPAVPRSPSPLEPSPSTPTQLPAAPWPVPSPSLPPAHVPRPSPAAAVPRVPPETSASDEAQALDRAMTLLRRDHDGLGALAELDAYLDRHPQGILNREARFARVDALLLLGRSDQALAALEILPLDRGRRSTELQVIRAELRARTSCASALADFGEALTRSPNAGLLERILYGRGVCRSKLGDTAGAAEDLGRYVERFPNGVHALSARRWLSTTGPHARREDAP